MVSAHQIDVTGEDNAKLKQYINRIERMEEEKKEISQQISETYSEAKALGFDTKAMRQVIKLRKMKEDEMKEQEMLVEIYMNALENA